MILKLKLPKMVRICPLIRETFKGDDNAVVAKLKMKTSKCPFQGMLNNKGDKSQKQKIYVMTPALPLLGGQGVNWMSYLDSLLLRS